ncbi:hypothetical protein Q0590_07245 [Rhodocytophaga aerolata]|uniref:Glycosyltransferase RgtA/B/C/D-like domain-containing protein n=1 Tax=Rhodocytophaga aerolata TaxID=455078 RepID=A0ABT8R1S6_9BACT|nr:hypothetical protein [Rhodocytophaga aerolata]MDO1446040.1 hypothetical protein [Rhodocytophaga aerolata]
MKRLQVLLFRLTLLLMVASCMGSTLVTIVYSYEEFTASIASSIGQPEKLAKFRELLLTQERFSLLRIISFFSSSIWVAILPFLWKQAVSVPAVTSRIAAYSNKQIKKYVSFWQAMPITIKYMAGILLLLIILSRFYFLFRFPFHVDERFTYLYFVDKGFLVSMTYYPGPSNHIFYTLICNFFDLFIADPVVVMKLPALLISIALSVVFWLIISQYFTYSIALLIAALFSFAEPVFYYSIQGRGYILLMFLTLIATQNAIKITQSNRLSFSYFFWLGVSATLGFYTLPIFLYPFVSLLLFITWQLIIQRNYTFFQPLFITCMAIAGSVFILYLPVIVFNGWRALIANSWVAPIPWQEFIPFFPQHLLKLASEIWGGLPGGIWLTSVCILFCVGGMINNNWVSVVRPWQQIYLLNLIVVIGISFLQRLLVPLRVLFYLSIYQYILLVYAALKVVQFVSAYLPIYLPAEHLQNTEKDKTTYPVNRLPMPLLLGLVYILLNVYTFYSLTKPGQFPAYKSFDATAQWLYNHRANNIFVNEYDYSLCIRFLYETRGHEIHLDTNQPQPGKEYTYVVIHKNSPYPAQLLLNQYTQVYTDSQIAIYKKMLL